MRRRNTVTFFLVLILGLTLGMVLIATSAERRAALSETGFQTLIGSIAAKMPQLTYSQSQDVRSAFRDWVTASEPESVTLIIGRDLGIAVVMAVILTIVLELYARQRLADDIREGVVEAVFQRFVPPAIFAEIRDHVLSARSLKRQWRLEMTVYRDSALALLDPGYFVSRTVVSYRVYNMTNYACEEPLRSHLDKDVVGKDAQGRPLPRFEEVRIGDEIFEGEKLGKLLSEDGLSYETMRSLPRNGQDCLIVTNDIREIIKVPDTFCWSMSSTTEEAEIVIDASASTVTDIAFEVTALHPDRARLVETIAGRTWVFAGGMLPWQGFQIRSYFKKPPVQEQPGPLPIEAQGAAERQDDNLRSKV
jgi:hypothetical protein